MTTLVDWQGKVSIGMFDAAVYREFFFSSFTTDVDWWLVMATSIGAGDVIVEPTIVYNCVKILLISPEQSNKGKLMYTSC